MSLSVAERSDEDFVAMLDRFTRLVRREYGRPWTKRRYGYYEPPSALRRKRSKMRKLQAQSGGLRLHIDMDAQFRHTGPTNAAGR